MISVGDKGSHPKYAHVAIEGEPSLAIIGLGLGGGVGHHHHRRRCVQEDCCSGKAEEEPQAARQVTNSIQSTAI